MLHFEVNNELVKLKTNWEEINLLEAINVLKISLTLPESLRAIYAEKLSEEPDEDKVEKLLSSITEEETFKTIPVVYGNLIKALSDISPKTLNQIPSESRRALYAQYIQPIVLGLLFAPTYEYKSPRFFEFEGVKYFLPNVLKIEDLEVPGIDLTAIEFTEAADLQIAASQMEAGRLENASKIVAILCRPEGEEYDEKVMLQRALSFQKLPMSVVWEVFFCLRESLIILQLHAQRSFLGQEIRKAKNHSKSKHTVGILQLLKLPKQERLAALKKLRSRKLKIS